ncbi:MAG: hypothetical protein KJ941_00480 [Bacteroidetes bacterium]|nr:hypothetical protein [Bacteroidota bacterium]
MKNILIITAFLAFLPFIGCNKPEVIPAPSERIELKQHFIGTINGTQVEWTKNVDGYKNITASEYEIDTALYIFHWKYYAGMASEADPKTVRIGIGSLQHDPNVRADPSIESFKNFVAKFGDPNTAPGFSDNASDGFEVQYVDPAGSRQKSDETNPGTYTFTNLQYKEDQNGEYMTFVCKFSATVYDKRRDTAKMIDTIHKLSVIQDATFTGYFKRVK